MCNDYEEYKQKMDEVILPRGKKVNSNDTQNEIGSSLFEKGMTKEEMFQRLKQLQQHVNDRSFSNVDYDKDKLTEWFKEAINNKELNEDNLPDAMVGTFDGLADDTIKHNNPTD